MLLHCGSDERNELPRRQDLDGAARIALRKDVEVALACHHGEAAEAASQRQLLPRALQLDQLLHIVSVDVGLTQEHLLYLLVGLQRLLRALDRRFSADLRQGTTEATEIGRSMLVAGPSPRLFRSFRWWGASSTEIIVFGRSSGQLDFGPSESGPTYKRFLICVSCAASSVDGPGLAAATAGRARRPDPAAEEA